MGRAANLHFLRGFNDAAVLTAVRFGDGSADRTTIAEASGLTPQAVSKILARLIDDGLVEETGRRQGGGRGKPATLYRMRRGGAYAAGVHVSWDHLRVVVVDLAGHVVAGSETDLPAQFDPGYLVNEIAVHLDRVLARIEEIAPMFVGLGVAMPGPLDHESGIVHGNLTSGPWRDVPLRDLLVERLDLPVVLDRNTNAVAVAQGWERGADLGDTLFVMADLGVGGALRLDGRVHRGRHTNAGEIGHTVIAADGPECGCGRRGCVEAVHNLALAQGDVAQAARVLGIGVANAVQIVDVQRVVLTGRQVEAAPQVYLDAVRAALAEIVLRADLMHIEVDVVASTAQTVAAGAAVEVLEAFYGLPQPLAARDDYLAEVSG